MAEKTVEQLQKQIKTNNAALASLRDKKEALAEKIEEIKKDIRKKQDETDPLEEELRRRQNEVRQAEGTLVPESSISLADDSTETEGEEG